MGNTSAQDTRDITIIGGLLFLFIAATVERTHLRGTPEQLRAQIISTTFRPGVILTSHLLFPLVLLLNGSAWVGTYLPPNGALRTLVLVLLVGVGLVMLLGAVGIGAVLVLKALG